MSRAINLRAALAAFTLLGGVAGHAAADMINIAGSPPDSPEMTGATFTGTIEYNALTPDTGTLVVSLTNTSPMDVGGFLTGFLFNFDSGDPLASATLSFTDTNFLNTGPDMGSPFGDFLAGASLGGVFLDGGNPSQGLAIGESGTFTFDVAASDADFLTASSFVSGPNEFNFLVRFRGLSGGLSDKVPTPTPGTMVLVAAGGMLLLRRKR